MPTATKIEDNEPSAPDAKLVGHVEGIKKLHRKVPTRSRLALLPPSQSYLPAKHFSGFSCATSAHNGLTVPQRLAPQTCQGLRACQYPLPSNAIDHVRQVCRMRPSLLLRPRCVATPHSHAVFSHGRALLRSLVSLPNAQAADRCPVAGPVEVLGTLQPRRLPSYPVSCQPEGSRHARIASQKPKACLDPRNL